MLSENGFSRSVFFKRLFSEGVFLQSVYTSYVSELFFSSEKLEGHFLLISNISDFGINLSRLFYNFGHIWYGHYQEYDHSGWKYAQLIVMKWQICKGYCGQFKQVRPWNSLFIQSSTPVDNDDENCSEQDNNKNNNMTTLMMVFFFNAGANL